MSNEAFACGKIDALVADGGRWRGWEGLDCFAALAMTAWGWGNLTRDWWNAMLAHGGTWRGWGGLDCFARARNDGMGMGQSYP